MAEAQPAAPAAHVVPASQYPTIHLPPGTSVTLTAGGGNQGTIVQLHQQRCARHRPEVRCRCTGCFGIVGSGSSYLLIGASL